MSIHAPKAQKTVLVATSFGINVRDVLRSDVFRILRESGHCIVILSPAYDHPDFIREFSAPNVAIEPMVHHEPTEWETWFDNCRFTLFPDFAPAVAHRASPRRRRSLPKRIVVRAALAGRQLIGRRNTERLLARANLYLFPDRYYADLFRRYRPDLVCLTRVFGFSDDYLVLKRAIMERVPSVLLVPSWDNLTSKGVLPARVDRMVVWSEEMAREAVELHGFARDQVYVAGAPQFDLYWDRNQLTDRTEFCRKLGADPNRPIITFTLTADTLAPYENEVVEMLARKMAAGALVKSCQLLVRTYPCWKGQEAPPLHLGQLPGVIVDVPGKSSKAYLDRDLSVEDQRHLGATILHSEVVINTASTTAIDAAVFDRPVICAGFDGAHTLPYLDSVRRLYDHAHYRKLLDCGGVRLAGGLDELVGHINAYLREPSLDREGRRRIVERHCGPLDGGAGRRIGNHLLEVLLQLGDRGQTARSS